MNRHLSTQDRLNQHLTQLETQLEIGNLSELSPSQRTCIENQLRDQYDIDDLGLLFGTPEGHRYMQLRTRLIEQTDQPRSQVA